MSHREAVSSNKASVDKFCISFANITDAGENLLQKAYISDKAELFS